MGQVYDSQHNAVGGPVRNRRRFRRPRLARPLNFYADATADLAGNFDIVYSNRGKPAVRKYR